MNKLIKLSNFFIFSLALLILFLSNNYTHITNNILSILPQSENKEILQAYEKYTNSKSILLSIKGQDQKTFEKLKKIEKEIVSIEGLELNNKLVNLDLLKYQQEYQLYLNTLNSNKLNSLDIKHEIKTLYDNLLNSFFPIIINKNDPLNLFPKIENNQILKMKNQHIILKDYGYFSSFKINKEINSLKEYTIVYNQIHQITDKYTDLKVFSIIFYFVENSQAIKNDVNKIILLAFSILIILYLFILKNTKLLLNAITTLGSSALIATLLITTLYNEVSIFVLVFGLSISTVAIDYMFHHYMHDYYKNKKSFNKEVFFGFLTTVIAFISISFISFTLIEQIAMFTTISLTISYLHFAFLYPKIGFELNDTKSFNSNIFKVKTVYILFFSITIILFSTTFISFDFNLKNLDYKNKKLDNLDLFFKEQLNQSNKLNLLIKADSIDNIIKNFQKVKEELPLMQTSLNNIITQKQYEKTNSLLNSSNFKEIKKSIDIESSKIGFKKEFFKSSYIKKELPKYSLEKLQKYGVNIFKYKNIYLAHFSINKSDYKKIIHFNFVKPLSMKLLFENSLEKVRNQIFLFGLVSLCFIILMVLFITKKNFLFSLTFLLFPLSLILIYSYFVAFNILHIFMMFIILAISIDYAIYSSKSLDLNTKKAILYSLLSTFAGFGVLIFSNINSLYSIGMIATIGILSIAFLLIFLKGSKNELRNS